MSTTGLEGVVVAETRLGRVGGAEGRLAYCGYAIEDLAAHATFEGVCHLLWTGELPRRPGLESLRAAIADSARLPEGVLTIVRSGARHAHPMTVLQAAVAFAAILDPDADDHSPEAEWRKAVRLTAQAVTVTAAIGRLRGDAPPLQPRRDLGLAANLLYMLHGRTPPPTHAKALDTAFILHAEHGMNPSTFAARVATSTGSGMHAAVLAALGTLMGPLHGGAPEGVMRTLQQIGQPERAREWVLRALSRGQRVMGFGHREYRTVDPRVPILRGAAAGLQRRESEWVRVADELQAVMDEEMRRRGKDVYANVDLFSAALYAGLGIEPGLFSNLFACARMPGCTSHIMEQRAAGRVHWPAAQYVGPADRSTTGVE